MCKCFLFTNYEAEGGGEVFAAETFFTGDFIEGVAVAPFEVDVALDIFSGHGWYSICDQGLRASLPRCHRMILNQFYIRYQP